MGQGRFLRWGGRGGGVERIVFFRCPKTLALKNIHPSTQPAKTRPRSCSNALHAPARPSSSPTSPLPEISNLAHANPGLYPSRTSHPPTSTPTRPDAPASPADGGPPARSPPGDIPPDPHLHLHSHTPQGQQQPAPTDTHADPTPSATAPPGSALAHAASHGPPRPKQPCPAEEQEEAGSVDAG